MPRRTPSWARTFERTLIAFSRPATAATQALLAPHKPKLRKPRKAGKPSKPRVGSVARADDGHWLPGVCAGVAGMRRYRLFKPAGMHLGERLPLIVMLHGCGQDAEDFALATRMNRLAARERFLVLYPEQDRMANQQRCWNWFEIRNGRALGEVALVMNAIDQACQLHGADRQRVAVAGLSAGASLAALMASRHPLRFAAVVMHSGVPPGTADSTMQAIRAMRGGTAPRPMVTDASATPLPPLLVIHGASDLVVSTRNAQAAVQVWAEAAGARASEPRVQQRGKRYPVTVTDFKAARGRTVARLVEVAQLGHAWSGGAKRAYSDPRGPDASRLAWAFASGQFTS